MRFASLIPAAVALFVGGAAYAQAWDIFTSREDFFARRQNARPGFLHPREQRRRLRPLQRIQSGEHAGRNPAIVERLLRQPRALGQEQSRLNPLFLALQRLQQLHRRVGRRGDVLVLRRRRSRRGRIRMRSASFLRSLRHAPLSIVEPVLPLWGLAARWKPRRSTREE